MVILGFPRNIAAFAAAYLLLHLVAPASAANDFKTVEAQQILKDLRLPPLENALGNLNTALEEFVTLVTVTQPFGYQLFIPEYISSTETIPAPLYGNASPNEDDAAPGEISELGKELIQKSDPEDIARELGFDFKDLPDDSELEFIFDALKYLRSLVRQVWTDGRKMPVEFWNSPQEERELKNPQSHYPPMIPYGQTSLGKFEKWVKDDPKLIRRQFLYPSIEQLAKKLKKKILRFTDQDFENQTPYWHLFQWIFNVQFPHEGFSKIVGLDTVYYEDLYNGLKAMSDGISMETIQPAESVVMSILSTAKFSMNDDQYDVLEKLRAPADDLFNALRRYQEALGKIQLGLKEVRDVMVF